VEILGEARTRFKLRSGEANKKKKGEATERKTGMTKESLSSSLPFAGQERVRMGGGATLSPN